MTPGFTDTRPDGGLQLSATIYGAWCKALFLAQHAAAEGLEVSVDAGSHPALKGIPLQCVQVRERGFV